MVTFVTESANAMKVPTRKYNVTVVNPYYIVGHDGCKMIWAAYES